MDDVKKNNELITQTAEEEWAMYQDMLKDDDISSLAQKGLEVYEQNNEMLSKAQKDKMDPVKIKEAQKFNNDVYKSLTDTIENHKKTPSSEKDYELTKELARNKVSALKMARNYIAAALVIKTSKLVIPVTELAKVLFRHDAKTYQKSINKSKTKLEEKKEKIVSLKNKNKGTFLFRNRAIKKEERSIEKLNKKINKLEKERDSTLTVLKKLSKIQEKFVEVGYLNLIKDGDKRFEDKLEKEKNKEKSINVVANYIATDLNSSQSGIDVDNDGQIDFNIITSHDDEKIVDVRDCEPTASYKEESLNEKIERAKRQKHEEAPQKNEFLKEDDDLER